MTRSEAVGGRPALERLATIGEPHFAALFRRVVATSRLQPKGTESAGLNISRQGIQAGTDSEGPFEHGAESVTCIRKISRLGRHGGGSGCRGLGTVLEPSITTGPGHCQRPPQDLNVAMEWLTRAAALGPAGHAGKASGARKYRIRMEAARSNERGCPNSNAVRQPKLSRPHIAMGKNRLAIYAPPGWKDLDRPNQASRLEKKNWASGGDKGSWPGMAQI